MEEAEEESDDDEDARQHWILIVAPLKRKRTSEEAPPITTDPIRRSLRARRLTERAQQAAEQPEDSDIEVDPIVSHFRKRKLAAPDETVQKQARCEVISLVSRFTQS